MLETGVAGTPQGLYQKELDKTRNLFVFLVHLLHQVALYAEVEAQQRASKNLPNQEDLTVNTKLAGNAIIWQTKERADYLEVFEQVKPHGYFEMEFVKQIFRQVAQSNEYKLYITEDKREPAKDKEILKYIFAQHIINNELVIDLIEEKFTNWQDDGEWVIEFVMSYIQKQKNVNFLDIVGEDKFKFGSTLINTAIDKEKTTAELIVPKLKNWDPERIAHLDMILLRLGVCELLYFDTIPTKVTINEYIDLAKEYSTEQSGHFVNGILDNIHKDLVAAGKIQKVDHKNKK
jgi:N utilization substance protein B